MTRLLSAVVTIMLMLLFVAANQVIISNQADKEIATLPNVKTDGALSSQPVPADNDERGAHSYLLSPRVLSARSATRTPAANQSNENTGNAGDSVNDVQVLPRHANAQDLLRSGYLRDNEAGYMPDFGVSRKD